MDINKIFEVDVDTDREYIVQVFQIADTARKRERLPDSSYDLKSNLAALTLAVHATILNCEQTGIYKKGEAIKKVIDNLQEMYVHAGDEVSPVDPNDMRSSRDKVVNAQPSYHQRLKELIAQRNYHSRQMLVFNKAIKEMRDKPES
jgi:hypothetical protein